MISKKQPQVIIDSRHLKVLAAKKEDLKDAVVHICLDEDRYGFIDITNMRKMIEGIDKIEPSAFYFAGVKNFRINIFDRAEVKNRDIVITVGYPEDQTPADVEQIKDNLKEAFSGAKSITFIEGYVDSVKNK